MDKQPWRSSLRLIQSRRLNLIAATTELIKKDIEGRGLLAKALDVSVSESWPPDLYGPRAMQFSLAQLDEPGTWSLAYWVHPTHWRQGYATEAANKVLEFGKEKLNATRFWASTAEWNTASERVLEKLGMLHCSNNPQGYNIQEKPIPTKEFELTLP